jgi:hypothetical protein
MGGAAHAERRTSENSVLAKFPRTPIAPVLVAANVRELIDRRFSMDVHDAVIAKRFVLVDDDGNPRVTLQITNDEFVGLSFNDSEQAAPLITIGVREDGTPVVIARRLDENGNEKGQVLLSVLSDGRAFVELQDAGGATREIMT